MIFRGIVVIQLSAMVYLLVRIVASISLAVSDPALEFVAIGLLGTTLIGGLYILTGISEAWDQRGHLRKTAPDAGVDQ